MLRVVDNFTGSFFRRRYFCFRQLFTNPVTGGSTNCSGNY